MTSRTILPSRSPSEELIASFNFQDQMPFGTVISGGAVGAAVYAGTDVDPSLIIDGTPFLVEDYNINQKIIGGLPGVTYILTCTAAVSGGLILTKDAFLSVLQADQAF